MIECAEGVRNKALIAVLYESGARRGELENCKLKDVNEFHRGKEHGYVMKLRGKTGERQVTIYRYQQWLRIWLEACNNNDPETPLFPTTRRYSEPHDYGHLKGDRFNSILKAAAKKAGIKKNIHAHLLRHSQATRLANTMTEQQLKTQFGWQPGSNMTSVYVHLSGRDTQNAMLKSYGIVTEEDEKGNKVEHCGQCDEIISPGMNHCPRCGKPITQEAKDKSDNMQMLISTLLSDPEILKQFSEVLNNLNQG